MILSSLLTSVGINLALCFLFFTLYSILRKQPGNITVYAPRLVAQNKSEQTSQFNIERLLPSAGWVKRAWDPTEEDLLTLLGLDAVVFMRIFIFSLKVFAVATVMGIIILLPINFLGTQLTDDSDLVNKSLDSFSISNVNDGSNWLWVHFCAVYIFTGVVCYFLYYEYRHISEMIINCFYSSKPLPEQFTVLVRNIPTSNGSSIGEKVESFFTEFYPSTYLTHAVVHKTRKLQNLNKEAEKLSKKLAKLRSNSAALRKYRRKGPFGLIGPKVDLLDHYQNKMEKLEEHMRLELSRVAGAEVPAAFVSFKSRYGAATITHNQQRTNPTEWVTEQAPEPRDVHWPFFSDSFLQRWFSTIFVVAACVAITILFLIPVVIVQSLANLSQLETWFPFLKGILEIAFVSQVITGYLPSLILQWFLMLMPPVMITLSAVQGYIAFSQIQISACIKMLWFTIWNIFFANVLSGSALYRVDVFLEPKNIPKVLAEAVPGQASFFISYVVTSGWTSLSSEVFRLIPLFWSFTTKYLCRKDPNDFTVPANPYHCEIPRLLFFGLLGITYFFLAPLILPFLLIYYFMGYIVYRNQLLNVYAIKYEMNGKFWPIVHTSMIFSLVLMHIIAIGIFGLKGLPIASGLLIPLPVLTLLFSLYCHKRFLALFRAYPAECLIKKDRADVNDPSINEFFDSLTTAYQDPSLTRSLYSSATDTDTSPLLATD
ncbi:hypothetical protein MLD38_001307 [Melastoma candidum]|uniref:Uncharacterized protein n=1 Tax=Melastoma candidum TaxID=119954 RepID=A0ACB9SHR1_9MYRT|nr:hypothetical protein MLD38_001307 [Melastoma candidum]